MKPPSTARTAGRSDWAERRFRRQPFILLLVGASSISLVSAESGENSLIPLRLLFPPNPLRWASAGALLSSDNRLIYPKYAEGVRPIWRGKVLFRSVSNHTPTNAATLVLLGLSGYTLHLTNRIAHSGSQGETRAFRAGVVSLPSGRFARFRNPAWPGVRTANFAAFWPWSDVLPKNAESLRNSDALMRVAVPRRRGPAGLRDPVAVSLTAPMGFTVLSGHDNSMQRKILAGFTRWSAPCVLPLAAVPLLSLQHPSAADKIPRWKTGSAGSCRADFRFACARPA